MTRETVLKHLTLTGDGAASFATDLGWSTATPDHSGIDSEWLYELTTLQTSGPISQAVEALCDRHEVALEENARLQALADRLAEQAVLETGRLQLEIAYLRAALAYEHHAKVCKEHLACPEYLSLLQAEETAERAWREVQPEEVSDG